MEEASKRYTSMKKVLCPIEKEGKTYWKSLGAAFVSKEGHINVVLDSLPINGRLHLRDWDEPQRERKQEPAQFNGLRSVASAPTGPNEDLPF